MKTCVCPYNQRKVEVATLTDMQDIIQRSIRDRTWSQIQLPRAIDVPSAYAPFTYANFLALFLSEPKAIILTTQTIEGLDGISDCMAYIYPSGSYAHEGTFGWQKKRSHYPSFGSNRKWCEPIRGYQSELTEAQWKFAVKIWDLCNCENARACDSWIRKQHVKGILI